MAYKNLAKRLEKWAEEKVPLLRTYLRKENLREADKLIRDELVRRLDLVKQVLDEAKKERLERGSLLHLDKLDRACSKIDAVSHAIRFAARGYRGLFDPQEVSEDDLLNLLAFDEKLFTAVETLEADARKVAALGDEEVVAALKGLENRLIALNNSLDEREKYAAEKLPPSPAGAGV